MREYFRSGLSREACLLLDVTAPVRTVEDDGPGLAGCRWGHLFELARRHQVLTNLAFRAATETNLAELPAPFGDRLSDVRRAAALSDQQQAEGLGIALQGFERSGIEVMLLKGRSLAERLYADSAERSSVDIDLLVRPEDLQTASDVLERCGYRPFRPDLFRRSHFHLPFVLEGSNWPTIIELHWDVTFRDSPVRFDIAEWWRNGVRTRLKSGEVLLPPREEELVYTSFHGVNRGGLTLRDLGDVARLRCHNPAKLDWERVYRIAEQANCRSFLRIVQPLCESLWSLPVNPLPSQWGEPDWKLRLASNLVSPRTVLEAGTETWWPYKRILYWSAMPKAAGTMADLFTGGNPFMQDLAGSEPHWYPERSLLTTTPRLLAALLYCLFPLGLFPATRESALLGRRHPGAGYMTTPMKSDGRP